LGEAFALTGAVFDGEVWRLWTAHLAHWSVQHALLNALALLPVLVAGRRMLKLALDWSFFAAPVISIVLLAIEPRIEYRGASALIVGLWFIAAAAVSGHRVLSAALAGCAALKVILEAVSLLPQTIQVPSSFAAHLAGSILGIACAILLLHGKENTTSEARS
jgi:membrane associated rhomboid family serine protease